MNSVIDIVEQGYVRKHPQVQVGDTVRVHMRIKEGDKARVQVFEGIVIKMRRPNKLQASITVRKVGAHNVGVERVFPLHAPTIEKVEVRSHGKVRRAKLYYLRDLSGKAARIQERSERRGGAAAETEVAAAPEEKQTRSAKRKARREKRKTAAKA